MAVLEDLKVQHYFIGGGAEHSAEQVRRIVYGHQQGAEGVCEPGDLAVLPLAVPGAGVRVVIGSAFIVSNAQGAVREMYFGSVTEQQTVTIPANNTSSARSDLIVMRVRDPYVTGSPWTDPGAGLDDEAAEAARAGAQYVFIERIPSVPSGTTRLQHVPGYETDTAYTLARVTIPAMTGTVTTGHVTNLRKVARPRSERVIRAMNLTEKGSGYRTPITASTTHPAGGQTWPIEAENAGILDIEIPAWATHMVYAVTWSQLSVLGGNGRAWGGMWLQVGATVDPDHWVLTLSSWDTVEDVSSTMMMRVADTVAIPSRLRGTTKRFYPRANRTQGVANASPRLTWATSFEVDVTFEQRAI